MSREEEEEERRRGKRNEIDWEENDCKGKRIGREE